MKMFYITILLIVILTAFTVKVTKKDSKADENKADYTAIWNNLFTSVNRDKLKCSTPNVPKQMPNIAYPTLPGQNPGLPISKSNKYKKYGLYEDSKVFFDYLDDILQNDVTKYFTTIYQQALAIPEADNQVYQDPYSVDKMLLLYETNLNLALFHPEQKLDLLTKYLKTDKESFRYGFSPAKINSIVNQWGWNKPLNTPDFARQLVDTYDFSGDGRLSAYEFLLMSITNSKNMTGKFNYSEIFQTKLHPIFTFLDCDNDGMVSAENLWYGLGGLRRNRSDVCNIYSCMKETGEKNPNTRATNDFILSNDDTLKSYVSMVEFRTGILLGYLNRQVKGNIIYQDDSINEKGNRWLNNYTTDLYCEKFKKYKK
jgi:Ca2+-binding EF-hand superfamily protein